MLHCALDTDFLIHFGTYLTSIFLCPKGGTNWTQRGFDLYYFDMYNPFDGEGVLVFIILICIINLTGKDSIDLIKILVLCYLHVVDIGFSIYFFLIMF